MARRVGISRPPPSLSDPFGSGFGSVGGGGFGSGFSGDRKELDPLAPTLEQMEQSERDSEDDTSLLFDILSFPDRILGGQSVRALLSGDVKQAFLNNPVFQITDAIGLTDLTEDVTFADVREGDLFHDLGIGGQGAQVREGFANFVINLTGEILSSPLELMLNPFGKIPGAAAKAAKSATKATGLAAGVAARSAGAARAFQKIAQGPIGGQTLVEAVDEGFKKMAVFRVPGTKLGFVAPTPKNLDLFIARGLAGTAERLNQIPLVRKVAESFSKTYLGAKTITRGDEIITGARQNREFRTFVESSQEFGMNYTRPQLEELNRIMQVNKDLISGDDAAEALKVFKALEELGVNALDDAASLRGLLETGREYSVAQDKFIALMAEKSPRGSLFRELREKAFGQGDEEAGQRLLLEFPGVSLIEDSHFFPKTQARDFEVAGIAPREGVDFRADTRVFERETFDRGLAGAQDAPTLKQPSVLDPPIDPSRSRAADLADEVPSPAGEAVRLQREEALGTFDKLRAAAGDKKIEAIGDMARDFNALMKQTGMKDQAEGLINMVSGPYIPRIRDPKVQQMIHAEFINGISKNFKGDALNAANKFFQNNRKVTDLTAMEFSLLAREIGTSGTGRRPLKEFADGTAEGINAFVAKVFGEEALAKFKKMGPEGKQLFDYFAGNPFHNYYQRIIQSRDAVTRQFLVKSITAKGSHLVLDDFLLKDMGSKLDLLDSTKNGWGRPLAFFFVDEGGKVSNLKADSMMRAALDQDTSAKSILTTRFIRDNIAEQVREGKITLAEVQQTYSDGIKLTSKSDDSLLASKDTDHWSVRNLKSHLSGNKRILSELGEERETLFLATERVDRDVRFGLKKSKKDDKFGELISGDDFVNVAEQKQVVRDLRLRFQESNRRIKVMQDAMREEVADIRRIRGDLISEGKEEVTSRLEIVKRLQGGLKEGGADSTAQAMEIMKHLQRNGSIAVDELREKFPDIFKNLSKNGNSRIVAMDGAVAEELYGKKGVLDRMFAPDLMASQFRVFDEATNWWKMWTLAFPQTRVRDVVTNFAMLMMGGANPVKLAEAIPSGFRASKAFKAAINGDFDLLDKLKWTRSDGSVLNGVELYERMYGKGMLSGGYMRDELMIHGGDEAFKAAGVGGQRSFVSRMTDGLLPPVGPAKNLRRASSNPIVATNHKVADFLDGHSKITGTLARWLDGESLDDALEATRAWTYDPSRGMTLTERGVFRRFVPFYTWTKFAVEKQVKAYFQRPGTVTFWNKLQQTSFQGAGIDPSKWDDLIPDYITENFGVADPGFPLWRQATEGPEFYLFGSYIPIGEISKISAAIGNFSESDGASALDFFGTQLNPGLKAIIETVANRSFFSGRKIEQFPGESAEMFGFTAPKHVVNVVRNWRFLNEVDRLNVISFQDMDNIRVGLGGAVPRGQLGTRAQQPFFQRAASGAFGFLPRGQVLDVEQEAKFKRGALERQKSKLRGLLNKRLQEPERKSKVEDTEVLRAQIADTMMRLRNLNEVAPPEKVGVRKRR